MWSAAALVIGVSWSGRAQTCVTQSRMDPALRNSLRDAGLAIGNAVKANDAATVKALSAPDLASSFGSTETLVRATSEKLAGDSIQISQVYSLDASALKPGSPSADFSCLLKDASSSETDFSISNLPPGAYAFVMAEFGGGARPWLLSMLLQREGGAWKMAGFYPKPRSAAGHDGLWFWKEARQQAVAKQGLLAWLYYEQAAALLQPAPFIATSNLEKLRGEQRESGPPELVNGISAESPLVVHGRGGVDYRFTSFATEATDDGTGLRLMLHVADNSAATADAIRAHSEAAARALVKAHPELRTAYSSTFVFADGPQGNPPVVTLTPSQLQ